MEFSENVLKSLCKQGRGAEACRFLTIDASGLICGKLNGHRREIDARAIYMIAKGDNCPGVLGNEACVRHSDRPASKVLHIPCAPDPRIFVCEECGRDENLEELFRWFRENVPTVSAIDDQIMLVARGVAKRAADLLRTDGRVNQIAMVVRKEGDIDLVAIDPKFFASVESKRSLVDSLRHLCAHVGARAIITVGEGYKLVDRDADRFRQNPEALQLFTVEELAAMGFGRKQECVWIACQTREADFDILIPFERDPQGKVVSILPQEESPANRKAEGSFRIL